MKCRFVIILFFISSLTVFAENFHFGYLTPYNNAEYTQNVRLFESIEEALNVPTDSVIALKVSASSKNMLEIKNFKNLKYIILDEGFVIGGFYLSYQALEVFFALCDQLPELAYLNINDSRLMPLIKNPERLKGLKINKYESNSFQSTILKFSNLQILVIDNQQITNLPNTIGKISSLEQLELYTESLPVLPDLSMLQNLVVFKASTGKIIKLHPSFATLKNVKYFSLTGMVNFKVFPSEICGMESLEELEIELRNAATIPDSIEYLTKLKTLYLNDCNKIKALPVTLSKLENLEFICISGDGHDIDMTPLLTMKTVFSLMLIRCNYVAVAKQLQQATNLKEFIVPTSILPADSKKIEKYISPNKIIKQDI